jgi:hypothetical protein
MLSEDEDEDPFASTSHQQDSSGVFVYMCTFVWVHAHVFMCASLHNINKINNFPFCKVLSFYIVDNNDDFSITGYVCGRFHHYKCYE